MLDSDRQMVVEQAPVASVYHRHRRSLLRRLSQRLETSFCGCTVAAALPGWPPKTSGSFVLRIALPSEAMS